MGENSQAKVSIGKELGSLVKKNIRDYMMYIVLGCNYCILCSKDQWMFVTARNISNLF